jgi:hypothetical protein
MAGLGGAQWFGESVWLMLARHCFTVGAHAITSLASAASPSRLAKQIMAQQVIKAAPPRLIRVAANINKVSTASRR